jgi:YggT family protein
MLAYVIDWIFRILTLVVLVDVILTYFVVPTHPVRKTLDSVVEPLLNPIRRLLPKTGGIDFSPVVLMLILVILNGIIQSFLR